MTLEQLHAIKVWHRLHWRDHPVEKNTWEGVLVVWLLGWVGAPAAFLVGAIWVEPLCLLAVFLPGGYVALRTRLHRSGLLRCDWITALR
jgi:hypothetical protein